MSSETAATPPERKKKEAGTADRVVAVTEHSLVEGMVSGKPRGPLAPPPSQQQRRRLARRTISADPAAAEQRYINREQLRELVPAADMTLWRWQRDPRVAFPAPDKLGADGRNYWWLPTIRSWMRDRQERRVHRPAGGRHSTPIAASEQEKPKTGGRSRRGARLAGSATA
jgi:hypothetical protein